MPPIAETCSNTTSPPPQPMVAHDAPGAAPSLATSHDLQESSADNDLKGGLKAVGPRNLDRYSLDPGAGREWLQLEPCLHSQRMLMQAGVILRTMGQDRPPAVKDRRQSTPAFCREKVRSSSAASVPPLVFDGPEEKRRTFELALAALNFQMVFEDILEDSDFFKLYPKLYDNKELVTVVLWDYQSRKFQARRRGEKEEERWEVIEHIDRALQEQRTKLKACLARRRIKASAPKIEFLLPDSVRRRSCSQKPMPVCAWVNTLKTPLEEVMERLETEGMRELRGPPQGGVDQFLERSFYRDPHCPDMLVFSPDWAPHLHLHPLLQCGHLVCQDKSSCVAAHSLVPLSAEGQDVLVVNPGPGWVVAHVAVLLQHQQGGIVVVSPNDDHDHDKMKANLQLVGINKKVKVIRDDFTRLEKEDSRLKNVTAALIIADCSKSAINNIVQYVVLEGENMKVLSNVTEPEDMDTHITDLQAGHVAHLRLALSMPKMRSVAYLTRSVHEGENEAVVARAMEFVNATQLGLKQLPWIVLPPVLPFSAHDLHHGHGIDHRYVRFLPSELTNGCFLVCLARRPEDPASVVSRAKSKGLLGKSSKKKGSGSRDQEESGSDQTDGTHVPHRRGSCGKRNRLLRRLSSPLWPPALKVADYKVPEHNKVVFHPTPFK